MRSRGIGAILVTLVVVLALNVAGVLRYPGGPLRDPSDDGVLWLDLRPADQGTNVVGNTLPSDWAIAGRSYHFGSLVITNPTAVSATIEAVVPLDPTPGLVLDAVYLTRPGALPIEMVGYGPSSDDPDPATLEAELVTLPVRVRPTSNSQVLLVLHSDRAGAFGFSGLAVDYRVGPFSFRAVQYLALAGCLGPLPAGKTCPTTGGGP